MLYASRFDDVSVVVNIAGRFDMARGVAERFGEAALQQLHQHGAVAQMARRSDGKAIQYTLTQKVWEDAWGGRERRGGGCMNGEGVDVQKQSKATAR
eukprot:253248-Chlamydomonas_euryale.AAC.1